MGTYVSCNYTNPTRYLLNAWAQENNIKANVSAKALHTTILYSRKAIDIEPFRELTCLHWHVKPVSLEIFDHFDDAKKEKGLGVLVIKLEAPEIVELHNRMIAAGATHDYPEFQPHVTLSYDVLKSYQLPNNIPSFELHPLSINFEELNVNAL